MGSHQRIAKSDAAAQEPPEAFPRGQAGFPAAVNHNEFRAI
jgi:hypothetical protein